MASALPSCAQTPFTSSTPTTVSVSRLAAITHHLKESTLPNPNTKMVVGGKTTHKIVVCRDLGTDVMPLLRKREEFEVVVWPEERKCERSWLLENIRGASGVILMLSEAVNDELLDAAGPSLKVVSTMSVGYEHVTTSVLAERGVRLGYTPDVLTDAVADVAILLALMASRNAKETANIVQGGEWPNFTWSPFAFCGPQLSISTLPTASGSFTSSPGRTVGFLGFGRIAHGTLARLVPFGIKKCLYTGNPASTHSGSSPAVTEKDDALAASMHLPPGSISRVPLDTLAAESDVLFILAPGGPTTYHVVDETFLRKMKKTAILVNPSRGTLVDSDALAKALREGWIWAAGLDVVEGEPNVAKDHVLVKEPRCVILPHIGSATFETRVGMATLAAQNCIAGILGEVMPSELDLKGRS